MKKLYPNLKIIRIIRDEIESLESLFNLVYLGWRTFHHSLNRDKLRNRWLGKVLQLSEKYQKAKTKIDTNHFIENRYEDLINNFGKPMQYIGQRLDMDISPAHHSPILKRKKMKTKH